MSSVIKPQEFTDFLLKTLEDAVKDVPEERREEVKAKVLKAFSVGMFKGPVKEDNT